MDSRLEPISSGVVSVEFGGFSTEVGFFSSIESEFVSDWSNLVVVTGLEREEYVSRYRRSPVKGLTNGSFISFST